MEPQMEAGGPPVLSLEGVSFRYPGRPEMVLRGIDLRLARGEAVLLTGPTGCGKSTLLKTLNGIIPLESAGLMEGRVRLDGRDTRAGALSELAKEVGLVFQNPDDQLFCTTIHDEIAFGPQNLGLPAQEVERRVATCLDQVGLASAAGQGYSARLSGGQKQRLAIAAQLAMEPRLLALDEPISQLDPAGAAEVMRVLKRLSGRGMTILLVEHRLAEALTLAARVLVMDQGRLILDCPARDLARHVQVLEALGLETPDALRFAPYRSTPWRATLRAAASPAPAAGGAPKAKDSPPVVMRLEGVSFAYPKAAQPAIQGIDLAINAGQVLAVMGSNGSGKSTLLGIMAGLLRPSSGAVRIPGRPAGRRGLRPRVGLLFQNPDFLLIEPTLRQQLAPPGPASQAGSAAATDLAERMGLTDWLESPPWALSKGQRLRAALGSLLALTPELLLLDEPTTGQNQRHVRSLLQEITRERTLRAVVLCSHDLDTVCRFASRVVVLHQGRLALDGPVAEVMAQLCRQPDFCPQPPLALSLSEELGINPPLLTMDAVLAVLSAGGKG